MSQHLLKECDLEHKKPINMLNKQSNQTKDSTEKRNFTKKVLYFNDDLCSETKSNRESNSNFAVNFLGGSDIKREGSEHKNIIDSGCKETSYFINEELTKNISDINCFNLKKANENEQKINYYNLKKEILYENVVEKLNIN